MRALDAANNASPASNAVSVTTDAGSTTPPPDITAPTAPSNLAVTGTTTTTASLSWGASSDAVGVTGYDVYRGTTRVATVTGTSEAVRPVSV